MGTWGPGAFENDAAMDFSHEIETPHDLAGALTVEMIDQPISADAACRIIVVGECVAAMRGHACSDLPDELADRLVGFGPPSKSLLDHSCDHLTAVMQRSELMELWAEDDPSNWNRAMHGLIVRLSRDPIDAKTAQKAQKAKKAKEPFFNPSPCSFCDKPMGEEQFSDFTIHLNDGGSVPMGRDGWAHHECLNAALHPKHMIRAFAHDDNITPDELETLLERKPTAEDSTA